LGSSEPPVQALRKNRATKIRNRFLVRRNESIQGSSEAEWFIYGESYSPA
jgi:hypothetical protein